MEMEWSIDRSTPTPTPTTTTTTTAEEAEDSMSFVAQISKIQPLSGVLLMEVILAV